MNAHPSSLSDREQEDACEACNGTGLDPVNRETCIVCGGSGKAGGEASDAPSVTQAALRYRVKGAPDGVWHYVDHPELMRRVIATREEGEGGGYLYEVEPLAVIPSGVTTPSTEAK